MKSFAPSRGVNKFTRRKRRSRNNSSTTKTRKRTTRRSTSSTKPRNRKTKSQIREIAVASPNSGFSKVRGLVFDFVLLI